MVRMVWGYIPGTVKSYLLSIMSRPAVSSHQPPTPGFAPQVKGSERVAAH